MRKSVLEYFIHCFTQGFWQFDGRARDSVNMHLSVIFGRAKRDPEIS